VDNPYAFLDKRFEEIESQKKASLPSTPQVTTLYKNLEDRDEDFYDWIHSNRRKSAEAKEALLFDTNTMKELEQPYNWQPEPTIIHHFVCQMVTCSLIIKNDIDLKQWITRHMEKKYKEIFSDELQEFDAWAEFITDFMVNHYQDDTATSDVYEDYDTYLSTVAQALTDELDKYPSNQYMETYKNFLLNHI
jgi:succinate dehydrogenase flavin-adding protein (antitoxin of CptAB toxin-antitoxin module)